MGQSSDATTAQLKLAIQRLTSKWTGRVHEIVRLVNQVGGCAPALDLFVFGGQSTGKTAVVRAVFEQLSVPHVYVSCRQHSKQGSLLHAISNGLQKSNKRSSDNNYLGEGEAREQLPAFINRLSQLCVETEGQPSYIILDDAQRLARSNVLAPLLRLRELSGGCNIGVILISSVGWEVFQHDTLAERPPLPLMFRAYEDSIIMQILANSVPDSMKSYYMTFLRSCLPPFIRCTRNLRSLHKVSSELFDLYDGFVTEGQASRQETQKLFKLLKPHIQRALEKFQSGLPVCPADKTTSTTAVKAERLDFELPYMSKFLILAAYIASRNKPATDKRMFDIFGGRSRKRRRVSTSRSDKQAVAATTAMLAGPGSFEGERLLSIFWFLLNNEDDSLELCSAFNAQSSEVFMQISSLVSLRLLSKVSRDDALEKCKYRCNVSDELAQRVARNLQVELNKYLVYV